MPPPIQGAAMPYSPKLGRTKKRASTHAEALIWRDTAVANGGQVTPAQLAAVSDFCKAIDAAGLRDRFIRLSLLAGNNIAAAQVPLYRSFDAQEPHYGTTLDVNNGFADGLNQYGVSNGYMPNQGIYGNGESRYLNTNLWLGDCVEAGMSGTDCHASLWWKGDGYGVNVGAQDYQLIDNLGGLMLTTYPYSNSVFCPGEVEGDCGTFSNGIVLDGFHLGTRWSSTPSHAAYIKDGVDVSGQRFSGYISTWSAASEMPLGVMAIYDPAAGGYDFETNTGTPGWYYGQGTMGMYSFGKKFQSQSQWTLFNLAVRDAMQAMGRWYP